MSGPRLIGRATRQKTRILPAPSSMAASSTSTGMLRKNWRRKNSANGVISRLGATIPNTLFSRPRSRTSTKLGSSVKMPGTMSAAMSTAKRRLRPGNRSRAKAYPPMAQKRVWKNPIREQ